MEIAISYSKLADRIIRAKIETGITQKEIAEQVGIATSQICHLKYNKDYSCISVKALIKLAIVLKCKIDDIIDYKVVK